MWFWFATTCPSATLMPTSLGTSALYSNTASYGSTAPAVSTSRLPSCMTTGANSCDRCSRATFSGTSCACPFSPKGMAGDTSSFASCFDTAYSLRPTHVRIGNGFHGPSSTDTCTVPRTTFLAGRWSGSSRLGTFTSTFGPCSTTKCGLLLLMSCL